MLEKTININEDESHQEKRLYTYFIMFASILITAAFLFNSPSEIIKGNIVILTSPDNLVTDYFKIANIGAALFNAAIMVVQAIIMIKLSKQAINGLLVASIFTLAGFSLFGKNLYNSTPIIIGVLAYAKVSKTPFNQLIPVALFGTALGPVVSEVTFNFSLPTFQAVFFGISAGFISGFILPVLAQHYKNFHKGFSLYNIGFTAGITATMCTALFRGLGYKVETVSLISRGNNKELSFFLFLLFGIMLIAGLVANQWSFRGYGLLLKESGHGGSDFIKDYGRGLVYINMALLGIVFTAYVLFVGGDLNGPTIGGILTIVGFGASGKHLKNVLPILFGVFLASYFSIHDVNSTAALLAALFGTTLAPVSGCYGPLAGVIAGAFHMIFAANLSFLNAGLNLYNNGFSGGFIAAILVPILDEIYKIKDKIKTF
ncbi:MAG TPA: DUF1576 domain-containing protein [Defluviitaleaceae bacterium]|nr:DUF1576 domain-containing protein [Candidatus Epulonipiscium sp.]HQD50806.1 DUF1576 domain-containing protein [Defluviitaleaceae bacterium]